MKKGAVMRKEESRYADNLRRGFYDAIAGGTSGYRSSFDMLREDDARRKAAASGAPIRVKVIRHVKKGG